MSRRANNVRGPTSALTEFLRESGITATTIARRAATAQQNPEAGPSNEGHNEGESPNRRAREADDTEYNSDNLDDSEDAAPIGKRRKLSKKEQDKQKAKAKAKKGKGKKGEDESDGSDDEYTALSRSMFDMKGKATGGKPPIGSFESCAKCEKRFTVTRYTIAANPPPGWLCHQCAKASGADPFKKPAAPRKRKAPEQQRKIVNFDNKTFPSLASLCIKLITDHIEDVEALGDIGTVNMYEIGRVLAKNRCLTPANAPLLYDIKNSQLTFYDATKLDPNAYCTLASLNPGLESLRLDLCGRIENTAFKHWESHLPLLTRLDLTGPFLVGCDAWQSFFASHPQLMGFLITESPRFDMSCMDSLARNCPNLEELRLSRVGKMSDEFLEHIATFDHLKNLELSYPAKSLSTEAVVDLLNKIGSRLEHLDLSGNDQFSDNVLSDGLVPNAKHLTSLSLNDVRELTDDAMSDFFFMSAQNFALQKISMFRNFDLADKALKGLLAHSGRSLMDLNINNWKSLSNEALMTIGKRAPNLTKLDIGWCRDVDDFVVKAILDGCPDILEISAFGCNKLTEYCPRKRGTSIRGNEAERNTLAV